MPWREDDEFDSSICATFSAIAKISSGIAHWKNGGNER
jgi:hypothetical protein